MSNDYDGRIPPSERKARRTATKVTYWSELWRRTEGNAHGEAQPSPVFDNEADAVRWVLENEQDGDELHAWRRESFGGSSFRDIPIPLDDDEAYVTDPARIAYWMERCRLEAEAGRERGEQRRAAARSERANPAIGEHPRVVDPRGDYDATVPVMPHDTIYDEDGRLRPWILTDGRGQPRTDVVYEEGVPFDLQGYRLNGRGERMVQEAGK